MPSRFNHSSSFSMPLPSPVLRAALIVTTTAVLVGATLSELARREEREEVRTLSAQFDLQARRSTGVRQALREVDPARRRLEVARMLILDAVDPATWRAAESPSSNSTLDTESAVEKLSAARRVATEEVEETPRSWRAHLYSGAALYLQWSLERDERLVREVETWRAPIERAIALAPAQREPRSLLTLAHLELWQMLSTERRQQTREALAHAWTDTHLDNRILSAWIQVAGSDASVLDPLPARPLLHARAGLELAARGRWDLVLEAREREITATTAAIEGVLASTPSLLEEGRLSLARQNMLREVPRNPDTRLIEPLARLVARLPAGPAPSVGTSFLGGWLVWALEHDLYGVTTLEPATVARLEALSRDIDEEVRLRARLVTQGPAAAENLRKSLSASSPLLTYRLHLARHLRSLPASETSTDLRADLERELGPFTSPPRHRLLARHLDNLDPLVPEIGEWTTVDFESTAEVWLPEGAATLTLPTGSVPARGAAIEVLWNQELLGAFERFPGQNPLRLAIAAERGVHRLQVRRLAGGVYQPGRPFFGP